MPVTEFAVLPFTGRWEHSSYHDFPQPAITAPYQELPNTLHDKFKKSVTAKVGFFRSMSSHASPQALREPPRSCLTIPDNIFVKLRTSHEVLERVSGHRFRFFQQIQDPSIIHIVGKWDSTEAHAAFIASPENQRLLELFGDDVRTEGSMPMEMYHLDTDVFDYPDSETPMVVDRSIRVLPTAFLLCWAQG
ncbi:hypothetical protein BKA65DRAFT_563654 [Rhexocercosporidium sp. MPI-PUGE-AT-0058]|nr:hypothetical protein BKA65DRAFT_563654 [Rhexocercosporidium sp. MPI-PUGE-AT-0058]